MNSLAYHTKTVFRETAARDPLDRRFLAERGHTMIAEDDGDVQMSVPVSGGWHVCCVHWPGPALIKKTELIKLEEPK